MRVLGLLLALALTIPAGTGFAMLRMDASECHECCATLADGSASASICKPAFGSADAGEQTSTKPTGAWATGPIQTALPPNSVSQPQARVHASIPPGPPPYLKFGRFLL
jgi:hypothetical protein